MKNPNRLWIVVLVLGWSFDFLTWKHTPGVNFAIFTLLCLVGGFGVLASEGFPPSWKSLLLLAPITFFAVMTFVRQEPMSAFLSYTFTLTLLGLLAATYLGGLWHRYSLADHVVNSLRLAESALTRPLRLRQEQRRLAATQAQAGETPTQPGASGKRFWAVVRGLLIALPILAFFAALLASADLVFAQRLDDFIHVFRLEKLPEYIVRSLYILIGAYLLAGVFLHAAQRSQDQKLLGQDKPLVPPFLGFIESTVVLGAVVILFSAFVTVQFQYFFGGQTNIHVDGYTYAEYARRGFGELVAVALFSLLLFLGLSAIVKRQNPPQRWTFSSLGVALVILVGVMLISGFQRLLLYEAAYGFSRLRTYTHVFMIWLGVLLAGVVILDLIHKERQFAFAALMTSIGFALTLTMINVDGFIVRQNVSRSVQGKELDVAYLASLSTDAVPALVEAYQSPTLPDKLHEAVGASLVCQRAAAPKRPDNDWRAFHLSRWWSEQAWLTELENELDDYTLQDEIWPRSVTTPDGNSFDCWSPGID